MSAKTEAAPVAADDGDDVPDLLQQDEKPVAGAIPEGGAGGEGGSGKQAKRYAKAMAKLGLKPEQGIMRVQIRKNKGINFGIGKPEVYRFPGTNTFVIFGETQMDDLTSDAQKAAARTVTAEPTAMPASVPAAAAGGAAAADEPEEDATGIQEKEIEVVMQQANASRAKAIRALKANKGDIVNAIMELTM